MKSLRSTAGRGAPAASARACVATRTARMSSSEPLNQCSSVSTEITAAPTDAYSTPCSAASASSAMSPFDGDARLNSAAIAIPPPAALEPGALASAPATTRAPSAVGLRSLVDRRGRWWRVVTRSFKNDEREGN